MIFPPKYGTILAEDIANGLEDTAMFMCRQNIFPMEYANRTHFGGRSVGLLWKHKIDRKSPAKRG